MAAGLIWSRSTSVFTTSRKYFVSCVQATALVANLVSGKRHCSRRAECVWVCFIFLDKGGRTLEGSWRGQAFLAHNCRKCCHTINGSWNGGKIQFVRPLCYQPIRFLSSPHFFSNFQTVIMDQNRQGLQESCARLNQYSISSFERYVQVVTD